MFSRGGRERGREGVGRGRRRVDGGQVGGHVEGMCDEYGVWLKWQERRLDVTKREDDKRLDVTEGRKAGYFWQERAKGSVNDAPKL